MTWFVSSCKKGELVLFVKDYIEVQINLKFLLDACKGDNDEVV